MLRFVAVPIICMKIRGSILGLTVTGLHSEGRGRCPAHHHPSPGTRGCGSCTLGHSLGPRGCGSSSRGRGRLIRPPWVPPFSEQENFRLFLSCLCRPFCIFGRCLESNPESCKQVRYQLSHPSPEISQTISLFSHPFPYLITHLPI
jgi:hypothetical protein